MSKDNRCGPDGYGEINGDRKEVNGKTDLEGLSRDGCSLPLGSGLRFGSIVDN